MEFKSNQKQDLSSGCAAALCFIPTILVAVIGLCCLPFGLVLIVLGIIWFMLSFSEIKKARQREKDRLEQLKMIRENTDYELCAKTLTVIDQGRPIAELDSDYMSLTPIQREYTLNSVFENIVKKGIEDGIITEDEEKAISTFAEHFSLSKQVFDAQPWYEQYVKLLTLNDLMNGIVPKRREISIEGYFLNLVKGEQLLWRFDDIAYYEEVKRTHYEGRSSGVSIRIAKGVYYRTSASKGVPVTTTEMKQKAIGTLFVATKNLYFYSAQKTVKIPFNKVVAFTPYSDGLGVQKDTATAKPQIFAGLDGWFAFNLVSNICNL